MIEEFLGVITGAIKDRSVPEPETTGVIKSNAMLLPATDLVAPDTR